LVQKNNRQGEVRKRAGLLEVSRELFSKSETACNTEKRGTENLGGCHKKQIGPQREKGKKKGKKAQRRG